MPSKSTNTLTVKQFRAICGKVVYYPHPAVAKGQLYCIGAAGTEDTADTRVLIDHRARIDLTADVRIGPWVMISKGVHIITHAHAFTGRVPLLVKAVRDPAAFTLPISKEIAEDVWLFPSYILPHCTFIAKGVIIGTGSVVTRDITVSYSIWAGNPARQIGVR